MSATETTCTWKVTLKIRVAVNERPAWIREGLATQFADFRPALSFVERLAEWSGKGVGEVAKIKAVVR